MSRATTDVVRGPDDQPQSGQNQSSRGVSDFADGSGPIFSMYMEMATEEDQKMVENWKEDANGILVFTGLFSAAVASLISVSIQDIRPNPQDTSNFYLANIYQTAANANTSTSLPSSPPPFSPPNYAVWVNSLWFMSLVISISCALLATLLQQWARRYLRASQSHYGLSPHKRAWIRSYFHEGVNKYFLPWAVETLPALLHISLFLFFAGLVVFLHNVNITAFKSVVSWVGFCTALYGCITLMPALRYDSPYYTSLSLPVWYIVLVIRHVVFRVCRWSYLTTDMILLRRRRHRPLYYNIPLQEFKDAFRKVFLKGRQWIAEEFALEFGRKFDHHAFRWTLERLDEDDELERFFSGIPGFRRSRVVRDPLPDLADEAKAKLSDALMRFFDRSLSSNLLREHVKIHRALICAKAADPLHFPSAFWRISSMVFDRSQLSELQTTEFLRVIGGWHRDWHQGWRGGRDQQTEIFGEAMLTCLIATARRRHADDSCLISAINKLGISEADFRHYTTDSNLPFAGFIHMARHQFNQIGKLRLQAYQFSRVLEQASNFDVRHTSPDLQHEFCALWNQIVLKAQKDDDREMAEYILRPILRVHMDLHEGTDAALTRLFASLRDRGGVFDVLKDPSSYPRCNAVSHIHDPASTTSAHTVLHNNDAPLPAPLTSHDVLSSSVRVSRHIVESLTDIPLDDFHAQTTHQATTKSLSFTITPLHPATTDAFVTSGGTIPHPTSVTLTFAPPLSSISLPAAVTLQDNADLMAPSDPPNRPSSASHPTLDNTLPTELHRSEIIPTTPSASTGPASAPDLGPAVEDDGSPKLGPRDENDALDPPSAVHSIHANTMATLDTPPQSPLPSATDTDPAIIRPFNK